MPFCFLVPNCVFKQDANWADIADGSHTLVGNVMFAPLGLCLGLLQQLYFLQGGGGGGGGDQWPGGEAAI